MPSGYLVNLGDNSLDHGDSITATYSSFTTDTSLGNGSWSWTGWVGGTPYTNEVETGSYYLATDGNVYFVPDMGPVDTLTSATTISPPAYTDADGAIDGTVGADVIDSGYTDADGDQIDNGLGGGVGGNDDTVLAGGGDDSVSSGLGADTVFGGAGKDTVEGGDGADLIYGDTEQESDLTPTPTTITSANVTDTGSGYTVTATPISGSPSAGNIAHWGGGFGVAGAVSDSDSSVTEQIGYDLASGESEALVVDLDAAVTEISFGFEHLYTSSFGEVGHWAVYNDGVLVAEGDFTEDGAGTGSGTINVSGVGEFNQLVLTANIQTDLTDGSDYMVSDISFTLPVIEADPYADSLSGGAGDDTIFGEGGDDILDGGADNDSLDGGDGGDLLIGGEGADTLIGGAGGDVLTGDAGNDSLDGGSGSDLLTGGTGSDTMTGGTGVDTFNVAEGDRATGGDDQDTFTLTDLGEAGSAAITIDGSEGGTDWDTLDLNGVADRNTLNYTDSGDGTLSGTVELLDGSLVTFSNIEQIICFATGTLIETETGPRPIETLRPGDRVVTRDNGLQPIRWIDNSTVPAMGHLAPIRFAQGTFGARRDLLVSPQHRMLCDGAMAELLFDSREVLTAAQNLINDRTILRQTGGLVTYHHLLLDSHEVIFAEGVPCESFYPGDQALQALGGAALDSLFRAVPGLRGDLATFGPLARKSLTRREALALYA